MYQLLILIGKIGRRYDKTINSNGTHIKKFVLTTWYKNKSTGKTVYNNHFVSVTGEKLCDFVDLLEEGTIVFAEGQLSEVYDKQKKRGYTNIYLNFLRTCTHKEREQALEELGEEEFDASDFGLE